MDNRVDGGDKMIVMVSVALDALWGTRRRQSAGKASNQTVYMVLTVSEIKTKRSTESPRRGYTLNGTNLPKRFLVPQLLRSTIHQLGLKGRHKTRHPF